MSLHTLAHHLQSAGRGEDKVLVHMTPGEVKGLQSLAMAHGGSLTINPETGLPEAGILKSLLPMIAGFALGPAGLGMTAMQAGLTTAAVGTAATGSLGKGLMMGMGAYSGAGLGAGLQSMANPAATPVAGTGVSPEVAAANMQKGNVIGSAAPVTNSGYSWAADPTRITTTPVVTNAPVPSVAPADASKLLGTDATNQAILKSKAIGYTGEGSLPVAGAKPAPFSENFPTGNSTIPLDVKPVRADTYFDSNYAPGAPNISGTSGGVPKGFSAQRGTPIADSGGAYSGSYRGVGDNVVLQSNRPVLNVAQTSPLDAVPVDANVARGLSGSPPPGSGPYDMAPIKNVAGANRTVIAKDLPPTGAVPTERHTLLEKPINYRKSEIIVDPTMTEPASITQYTRPFTDRMAELGRGAKASFGSLEGLKGLYAASEAAAPYGAYAGLGSTAYSMYDEKRQRMEDEMRARAAANQGLIRPYTFSYGTGNVSSQPYYGSAERTYFQPTYTELPSYKAPGPEYAAKGGLMSLAVGGPVEEMAAMNAVGANTGYPMANLQTPLYANPAMQRPEATNVIAPSADAGVSAYSGEARFAKGGGTAEPQSSGYSYSYDPGTMQFTQTGGPTSTPADPGLISKLLAQMPAPAAAPSMSGGMASLPQQPAAPAQSFIPNINIPAYQTPEQQLGLGGFYDYMNQQMGGYGGYAAGGGVSHLGGYSDGGRLLKGPGDGVSDSIPASIGDRQPARLADGEFVVPARIVSEIGNGSTDAGARKLYAMMDRIQKARSKTVGKRQVAKDTKAENLLPA